MALPDKNLHSGSNIAYYIDCNAIKRYIMISHLRRITMSTGICKDCRNRGICEEKNKLDCDHYDVALTRSEIIGILNTQNPNVIPSILNAVKKTYRINIAYST